MEIIVLRKFQVYTALVFLEIFILLVDRKFVPAVTV